MGYCIKCGTLLADDANFCFRCGAPVAVPMAAAPKQATSASFEIQTAKTQKRAESLAAQAPQAGEFSLGDFDIAGNLLSSVGGQAAEIISPIKAIFGTIGSFFKGLFSLFREPKNLIITIIMIVLWVALGMFRDNTSEPVKILSWLTFAQGGLDRSGIAGLIGGTIGKGTVAAALGSLFTGGIPNFFKGIGSAFKGTGEKRSFVSLVIGAVLGTALYFAFTGPELASKATAMAGIAGAVLSLESIGRKEGPLYSLAQSLTSKVQGGVRTAQNGKAQSLLSGLFLGFAIATALMAYAGQ